MNEIKQRVALSTVVGLGLLLMPLLTMWHELGGHALACAAQGGHVAAIGAFYVKCEGLARWPKTLVAVAGVGVDMLLALGAYVMWRRARSDFAGLIWWYVWVSKIMVAAGYLAFSGLSGYGDLAPGSNSGGGIGPVPNPQLWRMGEVAIGVALYAWLIRRASAALTAMLGGGVENQSSRRRIAHGYYLTAGVGALLVGTFNPVGVGILLLSSAASTFGGLAGLISIGFATPSETGPRAFAVPASRTIVAAGVAMLAAFALVLGPTVTP